MSGIQRYEPEIVGSDGSGGGGGGTTDRFAPRIIVGNVLEGDPAVAQVAPFRYIPDPGDGSGIELALTEIGAAGGGDVHIRPGTYDFELGAVAGSLPVPSNTRLCGAGVASTTITGRLTGDQRVFVMSSSASLEHMTIDCPSSTGGVNSELVTTSADASLAHVDMIARHGVGGSLKTVMLCSGKGSVFIEKLRITATGVGTVGMQISTSTEVYARGLRIYGAETGISVNAGGTTGVHLSQFEILEFALYGIYLNGNNPEGLVSAYDGMIFATAAANATGARILGSGQVALDRVRFIGSQAGTSVGVSVINADGITAMRNVHIDRCTIEDFDTGVTFGSLAGTSGPISDSWVRDCVIDGFTIVGVLFGPETLRCTARGSKVLAEAATGSVVGGVASLGTNNDVDGNDVVIDQGAGGAAVALFASGDGHRVRGNRVDASCDKTLVLGGRGSRASDNWLRLSGAGGNGPAVDVEATALNGSFNSNFVDATALAAGQKAIRADADLFSINNNQLRAVTNETAIELSGDNCTVVGNTIEDSTGTGVTDTGVGNEIAHNIVT